MSRKQTRAKKVEESGGSGLVSTLLVAGGAAAVGFLAAKLWGDYQDEQSHSQQATSSGSRQQPRNSSWDDEANKAQREKRATVRDKNVPENVKCIVCMENPREVILNPCGHVCLCEDCAENVRNLCPVCRQVIKDKKTAYLS